MAGREILNLHSKKTAFGYNSKLKILPIRCQTNTLLKSEGKREVNFFDHSSTLRKLFLLRRQRPRDNFTFLYLVASPTNLFLAFLRGEARFWLS